MGLLTPLREKSCFREQTLAGQQGGSTDGWDGRTWNRVGKAAVEAGEGGIGSWELEGRFVGRE